MDIDICTLTHSLPCHCLPCCLFVFSSSAYPQTDTAQLFSTHPDSCTLVDRTGFEFNLSFVSLQNKNSSQYYLDIVYGGAPSLFRLPVYCNLRRYGIVNDYRAPWRVHISGTALADAVSHTVMAIAKSASSRCTFLRLWAQPRRNSKSSMGLNQPVNADAGGKRQQSGKERRRRDGDHGGRRNRAVDE